MSPAPTTVIVTGASRGVGLAIVRSLASNPPIPTSGHLHIYACARTPDKVDPKPPISPSGNVTLDWLPLDITSSSSISSLVHSLSSDKVDVLINNAGINIDYTERPGYETSKTTIETNYDGTLAMSRAILPLLHPSGRIVSVSSVGSKLSAIPSASMRNRIYNADSLDSIATLRSEYLESIKSGSQGKDGWPERRAYGVSKAFINAMTSILARDHPGVGVNCCCVGWCDTDMGGLVGQPKKTAEEGARIPIHLAFGDIGGVSGKYWENESIGATGVGKPSDWQ